MGNIFFTSDLHIGHKNIIDLDVRPFQDLDHMEEALIENWNQKVSSSDRVYVLGDFCFKGMAHAAKFLARLNGQVCIVRGNHDPSARKLLHIGFHDVFENHVVKLPGLGKVLLSHFPYYGTPEGEVPRFVHKRAVKGCGLPLLHGHLHHRRAVLYRNMLNVGCMRHGYAPLSSEEVCRIFNSTLKAKALRMIRAACK